MMTMKHRQSVIRYAIAVFIILCAVLGQEHIFPTSAASLPANRNRHSTQLQATVEATKAASTPLGCEVISSKDAIALFGKAVEQRLNDTVPTDQVVFSMDTTSAIESNCAYIPMETGKSKYSGLAYYLDHADKASPNEWLGLWKNERQQAEQPVQGVGDDAYYLDGSLMVKIGTYYLTITVEVPTSDTMTDAEVSKLIEVEKGLAQKAAERITGKAPIPCVQATPEATDEAADGLEATATPTEDDATEVPETTEAAALPLLTPTSNKTMLDWATLMVAHVKPDDTQYRHSTSPVSWAGQNGATAYVSKTDCSGFLMALLTQTYSLKPVDFDHWLGKKRPLAATFYDAIVAQQGFAQIQDIAEVKAGDIIAIKYPPDSGGDNTGHILLIAALPQRRSPTLPVVDGLTQWDVKVIDQSESGHGVTDTRHLPDGTFRNGVGEGVFRLYADDSGQLIGYSWSDFHNSVYYDESTRPFTVGRLDLQSSTQ